MRGGGDRDGLVGRVVTRLLERRDQARIAAALDRPEVEPRPGVSRNRSCDHVARRELVDEAAAAVVEQRRAGAAERLREQEAVVAVLVPQRGRVELHHLEVGESGTGRVREQEPVAHGAARIRGSRPEGGVPAGRENDRRAAERAECRDPLPLDEPDPRMLARASRQDVGDVAAGVGAARVHDARAGVTAFTAEPVVELDAETAQLRDPRGSLLRQQPNRARRGRARAPRASVSAACSDGSSPEPTAAATPPWAA